MKNRTVKLVALFLCLFCGTLNAQQLSLVQGQWDGKAKEGIKLYDIKNGQLNEISSSKISANGLFAFAFYPQNEGYYAISLNENAATNRYIFYFKPGDNLNFKIQSNSWTLIGENSQENKEIEKWHNLIQPLEEKAIYFMNTRSTYKDFFPQFESMLPSIKEYTKSETDNKEFNRSFEDYKKYNLYDIALTFIMTPRTEHPTSKDYISFYREMSITDLSKSITLLDYPKGLDLIFKASAIKVLSDNSLTKEQTTEKMRSRDDELLKQSGLISNEQIKGELALILAARCTTYPGMMDFKQKNESYFITESQKQRFRALFAKLDDNSQGHQAIDFKFKDINGKEIALSDFKGKVVYIDVWATWCGPCQNEIPYMTKLEEEYKDNKNIVFMSVSVDNIKDYQKWKNMIKEKQMKGVQLFSGDKSDDIMDAYKIKGIPRFILVGKDGNLITSNSPRPSSSEIRPLINDALKK